MTNNPQSANAKHIQDNAHYYGLTGTTMTLLQLAQTGSITNVLEIDFIQVIQHNDINVNEQTLKIYNHVIHATRNTPHIPLLTYRLVSNNPTYSTHINKKQKQVTILTTVLLFK
jgi:hypothetical protein